jgi:hypothetical protein
MANPFPFVAGSVLTAAELNGIGESVSFTPTFSGFTLGNGTATASYVLVNKLCFMTVKVTLGSTSSVTGTIVVNLPFTAVTSPLYGSNVQITDGGSTQYVGFAAQLSTTEIYIFVTNVAATYPTRIGTSATIPMTWANTDSFSVTHVFEVA